MPNSTTKTVMVSFRLSVEAVAMIKRALDHPANGNSSVGDYCKQVVERHAFRHSTRRYKEGRA